MQAVISQKGEVHASGRLRKHKELISSRWHRGAILLPSAPALDSSARSWAPPASPFSKLENRFLYPFLSTYRLFHSLREHYLPWHFQQLHLLIFLARSQLVFVCLLSPSVSVPVVFGLSTPVLLHCQIQPGNMQVWVLYISTCLAVRAQCTERALPPCWPGWGRRLDWDFSMCELLPVSPVVHTCSSDKHTLIWEFGKLNSSNSWWNIQSNYFFLVILLRPVAINFTG